MKIKQLSILIILGILMTACGAQTTTISPTETAIPKPEPQKWQVFDFEELAKENLKTTRTFLPFLIGESLSPGVYDLAVQGIDGQSPHGSDEVYYVVKGQAVIEVDGESMPVQAGSIIFVKANVPHKFVDIRENIQILVIFSLIPSDPNTKNWQAFTLEEIMEKRDSNTNVWEQFLTVPTMRFGLYMLPASVGGDDSLTHDFVELNIVVNGTGTFSVGTDEIKIKPGTILYIEDGVGHNFHSITDDLDVLILWER
jgi:mannose-6-phosphate isomerase-like protein (cupin superfamily)